MRKKDSPFSMFLIGIMLCVVSGSAMAQSSVGIGDNASTPDPSSVLDVSAEDRGLLVPRVLLIHTDSTSPVVAPAAGLLVYNIASVTNVAPGYYYWNGTNWERLSTASETVTTVNAGDGLTGGGSSTVITVDVGAGQGIDVAADEVSVDVTDILGTGLSETANTINVEYGSTASTAVEGNQTVDIFAGTGLTGGTITDALGDGVVAPLDVGAGDGIEVSSTAVSVDVTDLLGAGLSESSNNIIVNYGTGGGTAVQGNQTATILSLIHI